MLQANKGKSKTITKYDIRKDGILLYSECGTYRFSAMNDYIVHVQYKASDADDENNGLHNKDLRNEFVIAEEKDASDFMSISDEREDCIIVMNTLKLRIHKKTGAITFSDSDNNILLSEDIKNPRDMESHPIYEDDPDSIKIEKIQTPDGVKERITSGTKTFSHDTYRIRNNFIFEADEDLYGLGQFEHGITSLRGKRLFLNQANRQIVIPYMISTKGYGLLFNMHSPLIFNDGEDGAYIYAEATNCIDYYFVNAGSLREAMKAYRTLTGKAELLPKWAFGYMQSQERYETSEEIVKVSAGYRQRGIGLDTIVLDWCSWPDGLWGEKRFDESRFPNPAGLINALHDNDIHFMISIWPNMAKESDNHKEFNQRKLLLKSSDTYDAFNKEARELYWKQANEGLFKYGVDAWWCDNSEPYDPSWCHLFRPEPSSLFTEYIEETSKHMDIEYANSYAYFHAKGIYEGQRDTNNSKRVTNLTRSAYTGSQRFGTIMWSGDIDAKWSVLKKQIAAGISFAAAGMPYWTLDIGAFFVKAGDCWFWQGEYEDGFGDENYKELFTRWYWFGAFLPIFRGHGTDLRRELWFCENGRLPYYDSIVKANHLRYQLLYYIYSYAGLSYHKDESIIYPLAAMFPDDSKVRKITTQYMFGNELMICPVFEAMDEGESFVSYKIYLPSGTAWYDFFTHERYDGGQEIVYDCPIDRIGVFVRDGAIIPMASWESDSLSVNSLGKDITVMVYGDGHIPFLLYDDEGDGYGFENGQYSIRKLSFDVQNGNNKIESELIEGEFASELEVEKTILVL